jgi:hypothetical protein
MVFWGCGSSGEYTCPDPVGKIILDDCAVYRTKYEALRVELSAELGPVGVKAALGKTSLRDPTELLQVLSHRTLALCKDFNACRVAPFEYRQRREQADHLFTAVSAIQQQLRGDLDAENKAKLVRELVRVLGEDRPTASTPDAVRPSTTSGTAKTERRQSYMSWVPWYGSKLLPPQPAGQPGLPVVVAADFSLEHVFRQRSPYGTIGYRPRAHLWLLGRLEADDVVTVDWGGHTSDCPPSRRDDNGLASADCHAPSTVTLTGNSFGVKVVFRRGSDGKTVTIDERRVPVLSREVEDSKNGSRQFGIDLDGLARQGRLVFRPYRDVLPPEFEQPSLVVVLKLRKYQKTTARCWVNGQLATSGLEASRHGGQQGSFQDRPRYERVGPGSSRAVAEPHVHWWRQDFRLPFLVSRDGGPMPKGLKPWPVTGSWRCTVSVEGEPVRELTFAVSSDGRLRPHPRQTEERSAGWLLETKLLKNPLEVPIP